METTKNKPLASPKEDTLVGNGMSKRETRKIRMQSMNKSEIAYMRRKRVFDAVWPFFRFFILFGLCFVILYPLIYMISCAFRDSADMSAPTVMWIPRHLTLNVIKETADVMDIWNTLKTTLLLNVGCSLVQVASCALAGYGFARFKFKGKGILFGIVVMMILVPPQIISIPQYMLFRHFGIGSLTEPDQHQAVYVPAGGNGQRHSCRSDDLHLPPVLQGTAQGAGRCGISGRLRTASHFCAGHDPQCFVLVPDRIPVLRGLVLE